MTLQGDVFDLSGTLEGGAPSSQVSILTAVAELSDKAALLEDKKTQLSTAEAELTTLSKVGWVLPAPSPCHRSNILPSRVPKG